MKMKDISRKLNDIVKAYMMDGYMINIESMNGSQGEIGKVDLVKGTELIRVWIQSTHNYHDSEIRYYGDVVTLRVGRWNNPASYKGTVWYSDITVIKEERFYRVSYNKDWFTDDLDHAIACQNLRFKRVNDEPVIYKQRYWHDEKRQAIASKYMKRKQGYKRVSSQNITVIRSEHRGYFVNYNDNHWRLH